MKSHLANAAIILLSISAAAVFLWYKNGDKSTVYRVPCSSNTGFCLEYR